MTPRMKTIHVGVGEEAVTLRVSGSKHLRTARILGRETDADGVERIWLDRVVLGLHEFETLEDGWHGTGAVSTVLWRQTQPAAQAAA